VLLGQSDLPALKGQQDQLVLLGRKDFLGLRVHKDRWGQLGLPAHKEPKARKELRALERV